MRKVLACTRQAIIQQLVMKQNKFCTTCEWKRSQSLKYTLKCDSWKLQPFTKFKKRGTKAFVILSLLLQKKDLLQWYHALPGWAYNGSFGILTQCARDVGMRSRPNSIDAGEVVASQHAEWRQYKAWITPPPQKDIVICCRTGCLALKMR